MNWEISDCLTTPRCAISKCHILNIIHKTIQMISVIIFFLLILNILPSRIYNHVKLRSGSMPEQGYLSV